jgi:hypothetical protein
VSSIEENEPFMNTADAHNLVYHERIIPEEFIKNLTHLQLIALIFFPMSPPLPFATVNAVGAIHTPSQGCQSEYNERN